MSAKDYSLRIENLLRKVNESAYGKSDEILINPYEEIVSALVYRIPQEKLDAFKLRYQAIGNQTLQELIDQGYGIEQFIKDLREAVENN